MPLLPMEMELRRVLVIRLSSLGDVLMTFPAVDALHQAWPKAEIVYLTDQRFGTLPKGCEGVGRVLTLDKRGLGRWRRGAWSGALSTLRELVCGGFDAVVDLHSYAETGLLAGMTQAPVRVGRRSKTPSWWYTHFWDDAVEARPISPQHVEHLRMVGLVSVDAPVPPLRILPDAAAVNEARQWCETHRVGGITGDQGPWLALFVGAGRAEKRWPIERFAAVASAWVRQRGGGVIAFGGPNEAELLGEWQRLVGLVGEASRIVVTPVFLPLTYVAVLQWLRPTVFLANDTGPMHLAVASQATRVVALFREPTPHFEPVAPHRVLHATHGDMATISTDAVLKAIEAV